MAESGFPISGSIQAGKVGSASEERRAGPAEIADIVRQFVGRGACTRDDQALAAAADASQPGLDRGVFLLGLDHRNL